MDAYAKSKTPKGEGDKRQTPIAVFNRIQEITGLGFCHDVCAEPHTAKVGSYWAEKEDALSIDWQSSIKICDYFFHTALWMNPPFSNPTPWVKKAYEESQKGLIIVGCLPDDRSVGWYQDWIEDKAPIIYVPDKRISFEDADGVTQKGNPKGSIFPVWMPMYCDKTNYVRFKL